MSNYNILIMGASYGSLLGIKLVLAGHTVTMVCLPEEVALFNAEGARVRLPVRGLDAPVEINSQNAPGKLSAAAPGAVDPAAYDLVALAMQEPQYRSPGVRELLDAVAIAKVPCMSIMNMPPPPYLARIPGLDAGALHDCYTDHAIWENFDPALVTLCSPDAQAFRPPEEKVNLLQVGLPTNFKAARFASDRHTAMLHRLEADIEAIRYDAGGEKIELPVKLRVHESLFVPLAKWNMLLTGNYRCVQKDGMRPIRDAVHGDLELSRSIYNWVGKVGQAIGAAADDLVPFEKYAKAAEGLLKPSSAARALLAGAHNIERTDRLVQAVAAQKGMQLDSVDETVAMVDLWLEANRGKA
ncbi:MAG: hypothetical protein O2967_17695 [Proteobacteria bacterium]|nr:hypothetical protein [Pseudomonadota bacterium]